MKNLILFVITTTLIFTSCQAQSEEKKSVVYQKNGYAIDGYDCVSYFKGEPKKGEKEFALKYKGATFLFASEENKKAFKGNPGKYLPEYGGWCAYAMGKDGAFVEIDPRTYKIQENKLYLFYNKAFTNTLKMWNKEGPDSLRKQADKHWQDHWK